MDGLSLEDTPSQATVSDRGDVAHGSAPDVGPAGPLDTGSELANDHVQLHASPLFAQADDVAAPASHVQPANLAHPPPMSHPRQVGAARIDEKIGGASGLNVFDPI